FVRSGLADPFARNAFIENRFLDVSGHRLPRRPFAHVAQVVERVIKHLMREFAVLVPVLGIEGGYLILRHITNCDGESRTATLIREFGGGSLKLLGTSEGKMRDSGGGGTASRIN